MWNYHLDPFRLFENLAISDHEIKPFKLDIFPTKYVIPKKLKG